MRCINISGGVDMDRVLKAAASEINGHVGSYGNLENAMLVISVRVCSDEKKDGT